MHSQNYSKLRVKVLEFASNAMPIGGKEARDIGRVEAGPTLWGRAWDEPEWDMDDGGGKA